MPPVGFEGESSNISLDRENDDYGGADFDIQGRVPGEPLVPAHAPAQLQGDADQNPINRPDHNRSDPTTPSSPSDDDRSNMYALETLSRPPHPWDTWMGRHHLWENYDRMTASNSLWRQHILTRFPTRADVMPQIPEPERQQMLAEEPALLNPPRRSGRVRQPVILPDNVYGNRAPADILGNDSDDVFGEPSRCPRPGPSMAQKPELGTSSDLTQKSDITAKMVREGGAELFNLLLKKAAVPVRSPSGKLSREVPDVRNVCEWHYRDLTHLPKDALMSFPELCYC